MIKLAKSKIFLSSSKLIWNKIDTRIFTKMSDVERNEELLIGKVVGIKDLSSTVREIQLKLSKTGLDFKAGQWIDFFPPGIEKPAGFSMVNSPEDFRNTGILRLAIKKSNFPPTKWIHEKCKMGVDIGVAFGGNVFFKLQSHFAKKNNLQMMLVAGGVGINPMFSIIQHIQDSKQLFPSKNISVLLLYTASSEEELIFKDEIEKIAAKDPELRVEFYIPFNSSQSSKSPLINPKRLTIEVLEERLRNSYQDYKEVITYICGPNEMIDQFSNHLSSLGLNRIHFEKWW